jgi:UDP-N-acetylglucosamine--N-acetylmuramyl-(pentapeptide) pyrophosphoryl-undecaprenol N-acetylglucosamine transferase
VIEGGRCRIGKDTPGRMLNQPQTIVFAGGGTGGHLFPGIAVAAALQERGLRARCLFVGSGREIERQIVSNHGFEHRALPVAPSSVLWKRPVHFANRLWSGARAARELLPACHAAVVVGLGGFASVPVVWAARMSGIPVVLLEQNVVPGRATSWLSRRANITCLGFADAERRLPKSAVRIVTGNPVRPEIAELALSAPTSERPRTLLVLGGSQGSAVLNEAFLRCVDRSPKQFEGWKIVHQTGARDADRVARHYRSQHRGVLVAPFFNDLAAHYRSAALAVSRAGAVTLSELACAGVPALLVPYRRAIRNHQRLNAYTFEHVGSARVVRQSPNLDLTVARLHEQLETLLTNDDVRRRMARAMRSLAKPDAAAQVANQVMRFLQCESVGQAASSPSLD